MLAKSALESDAVLLLTFTQIITVKNLEKVTLTLLHDQLLA